MNGPIKLLANLNDPTKSNTGAVFPTGETEKGIYSSSILGKAPTSQATPIKLSVTPAKESD